MARMKKQKKPTKEAEDSWRDKYLKERSEHHKTKKKLRVSNAQLKRYVDLEDRIAEEPALEDFVDAFVDDYYCPNCDKPVDLIEAGKLRMFKCHSCNTKGKIE